MFSVPSICLSVCPSVCEHSHGWTVWHTDTKFGGGVYLDNISNKFDNQGHRSKFKVTRLKNVISGAHKRWKWVYSSVCYDKLWNVTLLWRHMTMSVRRSFRQKYPVLTRRARRRQRSSVFISSCPQSWHIRPIQAAVFRRRRLLQTTLHGANAVQYC